MSMVGVLPMPSVVVPGFVSTVHENVSDWLEAVRLGMVVDPFYVGVSDDRWVPQAKRAWAPANYGQS